MDDRQGAGGIEHEPDKRTGRLAHEADGDGRGGSGRGIAVAVERCGVALAERAGARCAAEPTSRVIHHGHRARGSIRAHGDHDDHGCGVAGFGIGREQRRAVPIGRGGHGAARQVRGSSRTGRRSSRSRRRSSGSGRARRTTHCVGGSSLRSGRSTCVVGPFPLHHGEVRAVIALGLRLRGGHGLASLGRSLRGVVGRRLRLRWLRRGRVLRGCSWSGLRRWRLFDRWRRGRWCGLIDRDFELGGSGRGLGGTRRAGSTGQPQHVYG